MLNVILNILIINKKKWRQQLGRAIKRVFNGQSWWRRLGGEQIDKWKHPQTLPMLQVATSLHLGSWSPKKVGSEQVAQLMTINPKRPRQS